MTLDEVRREIDRLNAIKRELEKEEREEHKRKARQFVGKCYKRDDGAFCKIVSIPLEIWTMYSTSYNEYQFPALFLQFPEGINERNYKHDNIDEFVPCYCDTIYFDIKNEFPGDMLHGNVFEEITPEEFNTEFDKCIAYYKELINS